MKLPTPSPRDFRTIAYCTNFLIQRDRIITNLSFLEGRPTSDITLLLTEDSIHAFMPKLDGSGMQDLLKVVLTLKTPMGGTELQDDQDTQILSSAMDGMGQIVEELATAKMIEMENNGQLRTKYPK